MVKVSSLGRKAIRIDRGSNPRHQQSTPNISPMEPKSERDLKFCERWLVHRDHQRAWGEAGFSVKSRNHSVYANIKFQRLEAYLRRRLPKVEVIAEVRLGYERADILSDIAAIGRCNALDYIKEVDRVDDETGAVTRIKVLKDVSELTRAQAAGIDEVVFNSKLGIIGYTLAPALTRLKALTTLGEQTAGFATKDETKHQHVHFHAIDLEKVRELKAQLRAIAPPEMVRDLYGRSEEEAAQ